MPKKRVIVVTDGDQAARRAVQVACSNIDAYPLTLTAGNPSTLNGEDVMFLIKSAPRDPVVVMVDDGGWVGEGRGEAILSHLLAARHEIDLLGVVAVASATRRTRGIRVDRSVTGNGEVWSGPVDKTGRPERAGHCYLEGDTSEILLLQQDIPVIGCGDLGKMDWGDRPEDGAPITTRCLLELMEARNARVMQGES